MNQSTLHITNRDLTTDYLKSKGILGDYITWREMLCEGKTLSEVGSENFWKIRFDFLKKTYKVTKKTFIDFTLKEYRVLCQKKQQEEIVLWFDNDLHSQINMLALLSWLKNNRNGLNIYLIDSRDLVGKKINSLPKKDILKLLENKILLSVDDIEYADYIWQLYCSDSPLRLETVYKFNPMSPFYHLSSALETHLKRFPSLGNGLNEVENTILETANSNQLKSKHQLIDMLLNKQKTYGYNDFQYLSKLDEFKKLFTTFSPVKLSKKGKQVLEHKLNFYREIRNDDMYLGGAKKYSFLYVENTRKLLQITS